MSAAQHPPASAAQGRSAGRNPTKRLHTEMAKWHKEEAEERGIERLGYISEDNLYEWEAVINGHQVGYGYDAGRWLLAISLPSNYPLHPPKMRFVTPIVHPNIDLRTGEICLDLLKTAWTPTYTVLECVRAVRMLLSCPETDSPLNVDAAALLRGGDVLGTRRLVEYYCKDEKYEGN